MLWLDRPLPGRRTLAYQADRAATHWPEGHPTGDLFRAISRAAWNPAVVPALDWQLPADLPHREVDAALDYAIGAVTVVARGGLEPDSWHLILVALAELRDQRRAERRRLQRLEETYFGVRDA